jgi:tetratricopeptide (TPR) repeat protein
VRLVTTLAGFPRLLLAILTVLAFANTIPNGFVWIDHWQVESGGLIARSWPQLWDALRQPLGSMPGWEGSAPYVRPAVVVLFSLVDRIAGTSPAAYHTTLLVLHLGSVVLVYEVLCMLAVGPNVAWLVSAVFAVHPLQTAAVSWISGIADPLFAFFVLLAFRCELARPTSHRNRWLLRAGALVSFAIALGAKETAAVFPFLLVLTYGTVPTSARPSTPCRLAARVAPYFLLLAGAVLYRVSVLHSSVAGAELGAIPLTVRLRTVPRLLASYATLPLRVRALTVCDDFTLSAGWDGWTIAAMFAVAVALLALIRWRHRLPYAALGLAWMLLTLLPVFNVVPILHYRADRFFYFPLVGWTLAVVALAEAGIRALQQSYGVGALRNAAGLLALLAVLVCAGLTAQRNALFTDDVTLFESTLRVSPSCREARTALGDAYLRSGRAAAAVAQYEQALLPQPDRSSYVVLPKVFINLGMAQLAQANYDAAVTAFTAAHRLQPGLLHPLFGLGVANLAIGQTLQAVNWLEQAYAIEPNDADIIFNLALAYDRLGRREEARQLYRHYLAIAPRGRARAQAEARLQHLDSEPPR